MRRVACDAELRTRVENGRGWVRGFEQVAQVLDEMVGVVVFRPQPTKIVVIFAVIAFLFPVSRYTESVADFAFVGGGERAQEEDRAAVYGVCRFIC